MATSNRERVGKALDLLLAGVQGYVERELRRVYSGQWLVEASDAGRRQLEASADGKSATNWDTKALLDCMWGRWNEVFNQKLSQAERSIVSELRETRNKWAHNEPFNVDDTYRALDSIQRLLTAVAAPEAQEIGRQKEELLRTRYEDQTRREVRRVAVAPTEGKPTSGLLPWREIITPHRDVASGRYQQAEFAADLGQVHRGEAGAEYQQPRDFFRRTFLTEGLRQLLIDALRRLSNTGVGGDPVIKLQTNFGGGKTHAMLALYHLVSGAKIEDLPGIEPLLTEAGVNAPPRAQRVVMVGTEFSPAQPHRKPDGTVVHTMWGELAWQLLGADGYALVAEADHSGVSPGSDLLRELFSAAAPCLILIDEWVAYLRQLIGVRDLPAGSFDANYSFVQSLTEAARAVPRTLLVATLPESDIEIGGEAGQQVLARLSNVFGRLESVWRPASAEESFEIVRRRLFEPIVEPEKFPQRDAVVRKFAELYQTQSQEFPTECREGSYEKRLRDAYPIHPELFDRLYEDWSTLERFQRTRGVLRLMAKVIHELWRRDDRNLLILPGFVPIDQSEVRDELTRYLEENWPPVIERDVDGPSALPLEMDRENPNLGRYSACRRVARTLFLGSAPTMRAGNRGIDERRLKLGCVQPGESPATFGDALRRLTDQATFLYVDGRRYWFSTQPSVTRLAQDRARQATEEEVEREIVERLRAGLRTKREAGDFARVHVAPASPADVADERDARLVVLGPAYEHASREMASPARAASEEILASRGSGPRTYRNTLVFLAPDRARLKSLQEAVRLYLAWRSIDDEQETLNLDAFQRNQVTSKRADAERTVLSQIPETYIWLLAPNQPEKDEQTIEWDELRMAGDAAQSLAARAGRKLRNDGLLIPEYSPTLLRREIDRIPLWRGDGERVSVKQLCDDFAQYLYLPRLTESDVLIHAIQAGVQALLWASDFFAYAQRWDEERCRYEGLVGGQHTSVLADGASVVVKPEAALRQFEAERERLAARGASVIAGSEAAPAVRESTEGERATGADGVAAVTSPPPAIQQRRFHGTVELDSLRAGRDAGQVAEEVIAHLVGLPGARVHVTLEIEADIPDGAPEPVVRTVSENAKTLKFDQFGFEET